MWSVAVALTASDADTQAGIRKLLQRFRCPDATQRQATVQHATVQPCNTQPCNTPVPCSPIPCPETRLEARDPQIFAHAQLAHTAWPDTHTHTHVFFLDPPAGIKRVAIVDWDIHHG